MPTCYPVSTGVPRPLGAHATESGVNFSVFSRNATAVELLLFDRSNKTAPFQIVRLDPRKNRSSHFWHVLVEDLPVGTCYGCRVYGPNDPAHGHRFNPNKVLLDPYARAIYSSRWNRADACHAGDNEATALLGVVTESNGYDWEGDAPLTQPPSDTIIYEMHVGGFTRHPSAEVENPGTFSAVVEKIPYLKELGVTAVELMPIMHFDSKSIIGHAPDGTPVRDYWGYSPIGFFVPHADYCVSDDPLDAADEFRDMVKSLHRAGIAVILDVVFNHTTEGNEDGPTIHFKGLDNSVYYHLENDDRSKYKNYSGCGNTMNCNHPVVDTLIVECLEFWVRDMHVDGFRFDQGSILARGQEGSVVPHPPVVWHIELSETLSQTRIIAEAWDAAGLYHLGFFPGWRWSEWNGRYRDNIRRYVKGDGGILPAVASAMSASPELYQDDGRHPANSINFVTCHDGFTLNDLVSYNEKHNLDNGEDGKDGLDYNISWNCGVEGPTDDPAIQTLRVRQIKNYVSLLFLAQGTPMMLMGDEVRRTQKGNNNAYCHDNELAWLDWNRREDHADIFRFFKEIIAFRKRHRALRHTRFFDGKINPRGLPEITWHGTRLNDPGWRDIDGHGLAFTLAGDGQDVDLHIIMNSYWDELLFELPQLGGRRWYRAVDTSRPSPDDILADGHEQLFTGRKISVPARAVIVLVSR